MYCKKQTFWAVENILALVGWDFTEIRLHEIRSVYFLFSPKSPHRNYKLLKRRESLKWFYNIPATIGWWSELKVWSVRLSNKVRTKKKYWRDLHSTLRVIRGNVIKWGEAAVRLFLNKMRSQPLLQSKEWLCVYDWSGKVTFFFGEPGGRRDKTGAISRRCTEQRDDSARTPRKFVSLHTMICYPFISSYVTMQNFVVTLSRFNMRYAAPVFVASVVIRSAC